jgi:DNA replication terminus site-binding protein
MHHIIPIMNEMTNAIKRLNYTLSQADIIQAHTFSLPKYSKKDEADLLKNGLQYCTVLPKSGKAAVDVAKQAFLDMYVYDTEMSTRFTQKHLGLITVKSHHDPIREIVQSINLAKAQFQAEIQTLGDEEEKFEAVHKALPGLVTSTAYRCIHIKEHVKAVYLNWAKRPRSEKFDVPALIKHIEDGTGKGAFLTPIQRQRELMLINDNRHRTLRFRRPIKVRPECSVRDVQGTLKGTTVGLPFIILADKPTHFTALENYDASLAPTTKPGNWQQLIPRLNLYAQ